MLWGKSKEAKIAPCGNAIDGAHDEQERKSAEEEKNSNQEHGATEDDKEPTTLSPAEQV